MNPNPAMKCRVFEPEIKTYRRHKMRGTSDYDRKSYPFRVDYTGGIAYNVIDQRTQQMVYKGDAGTNPAPATDYAKAQNEAYWAKVDNGELQTA